VSVACPSCGRKIVIQDPKPGRFRMNCPACARSFALQVGDGPDHPMTVGSIAAKPVVEPEPTAGPTKSRLDASVVLARLRAAIAERWRWAWRAISHRGSLVGGALILEELGRTSRGTVARGRRVLLGRDVLIRLLPADWGAPDLVTLAKANREAYVAGEIVHPNLIRRLDFGQDRTRRYVLEESLEGPTLDRLASRPDWEGGDASLAIILHAARGLAAAHQQGLAHGDPSPENIWLDLGGTVKLAGLGLGETTAETRDGPAPFVLSATKDAQILGLTLDSLVPSDSMSVNSSSESIRAVAAKLKATGSPEGYRDLPEAIRAMETILKITPGGTFLPRADEEKRLRDAVQLYHDSPLASVRIKLVLGFVGVCILFILLFARAGNLSLGAGVLGLLGMTTVVYTLARAGVEGRSGLFGRIRALVLGGRRADWLTILAIIVVALVGLVYLGWLAGWVVIGVVAVGLAMGFLVAIDVPIAQDREEPLAGARQLLAEMRSRGVSELSLREFVCKFGGLRWEELFEALFGLDETRRARRSWADSHPGRFRWDAWRFPLLDWIDDRLRDRRETRARERFERLEEVAAIARKMNEMTARRKSRRIAEALIVVGREVREASLAGHASPGASIAVTPRSIPDLLREAVETPDKLLTTTYSDDRETGPNPVVRLVAALIGPRVRFLLGVALVAAFVLWADQVKIASLSEIRANAEQAIADRDVSALQRVNLDLERAENATKPLELPGIPTRFTHPIVGYGVGLAGLILILSALIRGSKIAAFALPGALVAWLAPQWGIPALGLLTPAALSSAIGAGLLLIGTIITRK